MKRNNDIKLDRSVIEFDYVYLSSLLSGYRYSRNKITRMLRSGTIIRIKKGVYVLSPKLSDTPYSKEILANLIYGPSYISLDYALYYYGLIPEKVETVTSVTMKRNKRFDTVAGVFEYRFINQQKYNKGFVVAEVSRNRSFLIASPEKALADKLLFGPQFSSTRQLKDHLLHDLRMEREDLGKLRLGEIKELKASHGVNAGHLYSLVKELK